MAVLSAQIHPPNERHAQSGSGLREERYESHTIRCIFDIATTNDGSVFGEERGTYAVYTQGAVAWPEADQTIASRWSSATCRK